MTMVRLALVYAQAQIFQPNGYRQRYQLYVRRRSVPERSMTRCSTGNVMPALDRVWNDQSMHARLSAPHSSTGARTPIRVHRGRHVPAPIPQGFSQRPKTLVDGMRSLSWPGQGVTTQRGAVARNGGGIPETTQASPDLHARPRTFWSPCYPWARHSLTSFMYFIGTGL